MTIPPPAWINIAHEYGVKILGTLIFEWDEGSREVEELLANGDMYAKKMVQVAKWMGFDGYLMNFECDLDDTY